MTRDDLFEIFAELFVQRDLGVSLPRFAQNFGNAPTAQVLRSYNRHRTMILLDNDLHALLHSRQYRMQIATYLCFAHMDNNHTMIIAYIGT